MNASQSLDREPPPDPTAGPSLFHRLCAVRALLDRGDRPLAGAELDTALTAINAAVEEADRLECLSSDVTHLASVMAEEALRADVERLNVLARTVAEKSDALDWQLTQGWSSGEADEAEDDVEEDEEPAAGIHSLEGITGARERLKLSIATASRVFECEDGDRAVVQSLSAAVGMIEDAHVALEQLLDEMTSAGAIGPDLADEAATGMDRIARMHGHRGWTVLMDLKTWRGLGLDEGHDPHAELAHLWEVRRMDELVRLLDNANPVAPTAEEIPAISPDGGDSKSGTMPFARELARNVDMRLGDTVDLVELLTSMVCDIENELPSPRGRRLASLARRVNGDLQAVAEDADELDAQLGALVVAERAESVGPAPAAPTASTTTTTSAAPADLELLSCGAACVSDLATLCSNEEESTLARAVAHHANLVNNFASSLFDGGRLDEARADLRNAVHPTVTQEEV